MLAFNHRAGVVLAADLGATHSRLAVSDLAGAPLAEEAFDMDIADGPEARARQGPRALHRAARASSAARPHDVRGIGIGVPGPVAFATGQPVNPPIMPGWDGFSIPRLVRRAATTRRCSSTTTSTSWRSGEHWAHWRDTEHLLFVKVGTGIGCGIVAGRAIHRGAQGAAGDIGHIRVAGHEDVVCRCGNVGCLEAVAGGARARAAARRGRARRAPTAATSCGSCAPATPRAVRMVREAGRSLGEVLAGCVNFFNPAVIVIGGDLGEAHEQLLAGVREVTFQRSLPLATRDLRTVPSRLGDRAGVVGAAIMVIEHVLAPEVVDRVVQGAAA